MSCSFSNDKQMFSNSNKVIVGVCSDIPPKVFSKNGLIKGYAIDLIDAISDVSHLEFEIRDMSFPAIMTGLANGSIDMTPTLVMTEERKKTIDFSVPYDWDSGYIIVFNNDHFFADLPSLKGRKVAAEVGTAMEKFIDKKNKEMNLNLDINRCSSMNVSIELVKARKVDAMIFPRSSFVGLVDHGLMFSIIEGSIEIAFGFRKNRDDNLSERISLTVQYLKENGELYRIRDRWVD